MVKFDAEETLHLIARDRVQWVNFVPTMMNRIWALPGDVRAEYDLSSLKIGFHMAAPVPPGLKENWIAWLGPERIFELYGGTERQGSTIISGVEWLAHKGSVGKIGETARLRIIGEDGNDAAPGATAKSISFPMTVPALPIIVSALSRSGAPTAGSRWAISDGSMRTAT